MHQAPGPNDDLEDWEVTLIQREARDFQNRHRLRWNDADDLMNVGLLAWWRQRGGYDPARGASPRTYLKRVVRNAFSDVQRAETTRSRTPAHQALSLDSELPDGQNLGDSLGDWDSAIEGYATRDAIDRALARMTSRQRTAVDLRVEGYALQEIAARLRVHRDTLHADMRRIRAIFGEELRG